MAETNTSTTSSNGSESNLPDVVASLEMLTVTSTSRDTTQTGSKRSLRKRLPKPEKITEVRNRRCSLMPKKRKAEEMGSEEDVKRYYLDRNVRKKPNNLETIYEDTVDDTEGSPISMSSRRFKRLIQFDAITSDAKIKKRRAKIKKVFGMSVKRRHGYMSMQAVINKLNSIRSESPTKLAESKNQIPAVFECVL